jgi:hypothetical protein
MALLWVRATVGQIYRFMMNQIYRFMLNFFGYLDPFGSFVSQTDQAEQTGRGRGILEFIAPICTLETQLGQQH